MKIDSACILEDRGILFVEGPDAKDFLAKVSEKKLIEILQLYAEIGSSRKIAKKIIERRDGKKMNTTLDLKNAISEMTLISGQKAVVTYAKKAISNFKVRAKDPMGVRVTLRRKKMFDFSATETNLRLQLSKLTAAAEMSKNKIFEENNPKPDQTQLILSTLNACCYVWQDENIKIAKSGLNSDIYPDKREVDYRKYFSPSSSIESNRDSLEELRSIRYKNVNPCIMPLETRCQTKELLNNLIMSGETFLR